MPKLFEKFRWLRDELKYMGPKGTKAQFKGVALFPTISGNGRKYLADELMQSARTLVGKPVTINHDSSRIVGDVAFAQWEDNKIEYLLNIDGKKVEYIEKLKDRFALPKTQYVEKWGRDPIYGVSVEANYVYHNESCNQGLCHVEPHGIVFTALSLVEDPEKPGVDGTTIELLETLQLTERSVNETKITEMLLNDYTKWHKLPAEVSQGYGVNVVHKIEEKLMSKPKETGKMKEQECKEGEVWNQEQNKCVPKPSQTEEIKKTVPPLAEITLPQKIPLLKEKLAFGEPFAGYDNFEDCVAKNPEKGDAEAYCATIKRKTEGEILQFNKIAEAYNNIIDTLDTHRNADKQSNHAILSELASFNANLMTLQKNVQSEHDLNEKQCESLKTLNKKLDETIATLPKDDLSWKESLTTINDTLAKIPTTYATTMDITAKFTENADPLIKRIKELEEKYPVLNSAYETLKTEYSNFVAETKAKLEEKEKTAKETLDKDKKIEEKLEKVEEKIETIETHVKPNYKVKTQPPKPQEPVYSPHY